MSRRSKTTSLFERLKQGLEDGLRHLHGEIEMRVTEVKSPGPPPNLSTRDVRRLRTRAHLTQIMFARVLNVSVKTVQSWEQGQRQPSQAALRLLQVMKKNPELVWRIAAGMRDASVQKKPLRNDVRMRLLEQHQATANGERGQPLNRVVRKLNLG